MLVIVQATTGIFGAFFVYQVLAYLFQGERDIEDPEYHKKESALILIYSIPFLIDFIVGILGLKWAVVLIEPEPQEP